MAAGMEWLELLTSNYVNCRELQGSLGFFKMTSVPKVWKNSFFSSAMTPIDDVSSYALSLSRITQTYADVTPGLHYSYREERKSLLVSSGSKCNVALKPIILSVEKDLQRRRDDRSIDAFRKVNSVNTEQRPVKGMQCNRPQT